jgi:hypothetical protein
VDLLREHEKAKANSQSQRKASKTEKVRSVTKKASSQAVSSKTKSPKPSDTRSAVPSKIVSPPLKSPKFIWSDSSARPQARTDVKERTPQSVPSSQLNGAIELPAEVPAGSTAMQETPKKGGLHIHLGSKHKHKEHGSGRSSSSKSLNIFRRSPHSLQPPEITTESASSEVMTIPPKPSTASPRAVETHQIGIQLSPPLGPPPRGPSPDPGLPTPPALVPTKEPCSYTALPDVLATAQRGTSVRASLRVSVPPSVDPEPEKTPKASPSQPSDCVHPQVTLTELPSGESNNIATPGDESKHTSYHSSLGEPGPEVPWLDTAQASEQRMTNADDEKTPTTNVRPHVEIPTAPSAAAQDARAEPLDTPLTSATISSYSDFYKLPPQQTPPPFTPEELAAYKASASSVDSSAGHSKTASVQETLTPTPIVTATAAEAANKINPEKAPASELLPSPRSLAGQQPPVEKKSTNAKGLGLKPRNKDLQNQSELLDMIASTPPHSPIHCRASSDGSATLLAVGMTSSTSRILAPPAEAPPPPAPGGRSMMIPDYAAAGAFEGERKPRRSSGLSTSGWKKMFAGGATAPTGGSPGNSIGILGMNGSKVDDEEIHMGANLLSGEGNDVLWYKGMGRDGLWVSGG